MSKALASLEGSQRSMLIGQDTHLKALYTGRYQQRKEQGVKRITQRMERPKSTPLPLLPVVKRAKQARRLRNRVTQLTVERGGYGRQNKRVVEDVNDNDNDNINSTTKDQS